MPWPLARLCGCRHAVCAAGRGACAAAPSGTACSGPAPAPSSFIRIRFRSRLKHPASRLRLVLTPPVAARGGSMVPASELGHCTQVPLCPICGIWTHLGCQPSQAPMGAGSRRRGGSALALASALRTWASSGNRRPAPGRPPAQHWQPVTSLLEGACRNDGPPSRAAALRLHGGSGVNAHSGNSSLPPCQHPESGTLPRPRLSPGRGQAKSYIARRAIFESTP